MALLIVNNLEVVYSNVILVLRGVSLTITENSMVALLGANGAGKSTLFKSIAGLLRPELGEITRGSIEFNGQRIDQLGVDAIVKRGIIEVLEGRRIYKYLTCEENIRLGAYVFSDSAKTKKDLEWVYGYFPRLRDLRSRISGYLSGGEQQMCVIGRALMGHPKLMLLDEPSLGLAPGIVYEILKVLSAINKEEKTTIVMSEQNAVAALSVCEYGYVMENGRVVLDGPTQKLRDNEDIKEFYLGLSGVGTKKSYRDVKHYRRRKRWL